MQALFHEKCLISTQIIENFSIFFSRAGLLFGGFKCIWSTMFKENLESVKYNVIMFLLMWSHRLLLFFAVEPLGTRVLPYEGAFYSGEQSLLLDRQLASIMDSVDNVRLENCIQLVETNQFTKEQIYRNITVEVDTNFVGFIQVLAPNHDSG